MKSQWGWVGSLYNTTGVLIQRGDADRRAHTGKMLCGEEGRDGVVTPSSEGTPEIDGNHQKLGERHGTVFPGAFTGTLVLPTPGLQTSGYIPVFKPKIKM